ncbi:hypothetical protein, partial [Candidatus Methanoperedens nitratireducens]|uniref:hypothetical protein n=1 Tax=Candidatus Methanoperedens nitratireducens TaxID=1392998 RepID=UPI001C53C539
MSKFLLTRSPVLKSSYFKEREIICANCYFRWAGVDVFNTVFPLRPVIEFLEILAISSYIDMENGNIKFRI